MNESLTSRESSARLQPGSASGAEPRGVRGWLLALCLMLTVVGPVIAVALMVHEYTSAAPLGARPMAVQVAVHASLVLSACAVAFGAYAGLRLWRVRPGALATARRALLFGLAVDIVTSTIQVAVAPDPGGQWLFQVEISLIPSLVFFTLCLAYLNHSKRVHATYGPH